MNIYFYFPEKKIGGVSILFLRTAKELEDKFSINTYLIDFEDGFMARNLNNKNKLIPFEASEDLILDEDKTNSSVIVLQSMTPWTIYKNIKLDNAKVVFWTCHPNNFIPNLSFLNSFGDKFKKIFLKLFLYSYYKKSKKFVEYLLRENSLFFMDQHSLKNTMYFLDINIPKPEFLTVAIGKPSKKNKLSPLKKTTFVWIGRLVDFKFFILEKLILDLENLSSEMNFELKIIGDGPYLKDLILLKSKVSYEISFEREIKNNELDNFLIKNCSILFAMGTAALEGAKLGIPTILLDISYKSIKSEYNYRWLYERDGKTMGDNINEIPINLLEKNSLEKKLIEYSSNFENVSKKTLEYFDSNHNLENTCSELIKKVDNSSAQWGKIKNSPYTSRGFIYNFYRILKK
tara:strand:+ start:2251 stop:3459 length:1209 start_codon:yes stop_codon:yes gene_type:complete